jgi:adenine phosphoribosyltransferase
LGLPFIPVRKEGKLPYQCVTHSYDLEYGSDTLQIHTDALQEGQRVVIVDDLIATGGTAGATVELVRKLKAIPAGAIFLIELDGLGGRDELEGRGVRVDALLRYEE